MDERQRQLRACEQLLSVLDCEERALDAGDIDTLNHLGVAHVRAYDTLTATWREDD